MMRGSATPADAPTDMQQAPEREQHVNGGWHHGARACQQHHALHMARRITDRPRRLCHQAVTPDSHSKSPAHALLPVRRMRIADGNHQRILREGAPEYRRRTAFIFPAQHTDGGFGLRAHRRVRRAAALVTACRRRHRRSRMATSSSSAATPRLLRSHYPIRGGIQKASPAVAGRRCVSTHSRAWTRGASGIALRPCARHSIDGSDIDTAPASRRRSGIIACGHAFR